MSVCKRGDLRSDGIFFFTAQFIYSADAEQEESGERERGPYYFGVEAADDTLMNLDHSRSPTQSYIHTSTHTIYVTLLIAPLLFPYHYLKHPYSM